MARKRFITSNISIDDKVAAVAEENPTAALMWPWFNTAFDDWGRMGANPMEVKLTVFPAFPYASKDIALAIKLYNKHGLAHYYEVDGKPYLAVNPATYYKYQTYIDSNRKEKDLSKFPKPPSPPWNKNESAINDLQESAFVADDLQTPATNVLSLSLSLSPSLSYDHDDDNARAREEQEKQIGQKQIETIGVFEKEFGRVLSPIEIEQIHEWENKHSVVLIIEALKRAVLRGKYNLKYINSILIEWQKNNLRTVQAIQDYDVDFQARRGPNARKTRSRGDPIITPSPEDSKKKAFIRSLYV